MKKLICSSLALICIASSIVGCSANKAKDSANANKKDSAIGKWQCDQLVLDGEKMDNLYGVDSYALFQIELKDGNKGTFYSFLYSEDGKPQDIEWEKKDGKIQLISKEVFADDEVFLEEENGKMVLDMSYEGQEEGKENKATLEKVDSFKEIPEDMEMSLDFGGEADVEFETEEPETETSENKE